MGQIVKAHNPVYAADTIIAQNPPPYFDAANGNELQVLLSQGPSDRTKVMPDFIGRQIGEVLPAIIERARDGNMSNTRIHYVEQVGFPRGRVVGQSPKAGERIDTEVEISLYVSKGS
jgi:beta-lactam-binding protein with PASTA domain